MDKSLLGSGDEGMVSDCGWAFVADTALAGWSDVSDPTTASKMLVEEPWEGRIRRAGAVSFIFRPKSEEVVGFMMT